MSYLNFAQNSLTFYVSHESALECEQHLIEPLEKLLNTKEVHKVFFDFSRVNFLGMNESQSLYKAIRALHLLGQDVVLKSITPRVSLSLTRWSPNIIEEGLVNLEKA